MQAVHAGCGRDIYTIDITAIDQIHNVQAERSHSTSIPSPKTNGCELSGAATLLRP